MTVEGELGDVEKQNVRTGEGFDVGRVRLVFAGI
jgi:hypothetical protein